VEAKSGQGRPGAAKGGQVRNELDGDAAPGAVEQAVAVRARARLGDISIRRGRRRGRPTGDAAAE